MFKISLKNFSTVIIAVGLIFFAFLATKYRSSSDKFNTQSGLLYEDFLGIANTAKKIEIKTIKDRYEILNVNGEWILPNSFEYPVSNGKVKQLLLGLGNLEKIEKKTSNQSYFKKLGLGSYISNDTNATYVKIVNEEDAILIDLIIGINGKSGTSQKTKYVRKNNNDSSWLVRDNFDIYSNALDWTEQPFVNIATWRVRDIEVYPKKNSKKIFIYRDSIDEQNFKLQSMPKNFTLVDTYIANKIASSLDKVNFINLDERKKYKEFNTIFTAVLRTFDGLKIDVFSYNNNEKKWLAFDVSFDVSFRKELPIDGPKIVGMPKMPTVEEVKDEVIHLNQILKNWVFEVSEFNYEQLNRTFQSIIKPVDNKSSK